MPVRFLLKGPQTWQSAVARKSNHFQARWGIRPNEEHLEFAVRLHHVQQFLGTESIRYGGVKDEFDTAMSEDLQP
jgi:hypothetical protein